MTLSSPWTSSAMVAPSSRSFLRSSSIIFLPDPSRLHPTKDVHRAAADVPAVAIAKVGLLKKLTKQILHRDPFIMVATDPVTIEPILNNDVDFFLSRFTLDADYLFG